MKSFNYLDKIKLSCLTSRGVFLTSQISENHTERNAFHIFKNRNKELFNEIFITDRAIIYQAKPMLYARFGLSNFDPNNNLLKVNILQNIAWFSFCLDQNLTETIPEICKEISSETLFIDDFSDAILKQAHLKIITVPFRESLILNANSFPIVGGSLHNKWSQQCLNQYFFGSKNLKTTTQSKMVNIDLPKLNDEYFWAADEKKCHVDQRKYNGWPTPISGVQKMILDQTFLKNKSGLPQNYTWGVYKK